MLACTLGCYAGALTIVGLSYKWFKPPNAGDCDLNVFLITFTLLLGILYSALPLHPAVSHGSLLCSAVVFLYCAYLTFSALSSEPHGRGPRPATYYYSSSLSPSALIGINSLRHRHP